VKAGEAVLILMITPHPGIQLVDRSLGPKLADRPQIIELFEDPRATKQFRGATAIPAGQSATHR
jgi:hypothetical protein